jgi:hypothetical protein
METNHEKRQYQIRLSGADRMRMRLTGTGAKQVDITKCRQADPGIRWFFLATIFVTL